MGALPDPVLALRGGKRIEIEEYIPVRLLRAVFLHCCPAPQAAGRSGIAPEIVKHPAAPGDPGDVIRKVKDCPHRIAVSFKASIGVTRQRRCRLSGDPIESAAPLDLF